MKKRFFCVFLSFFLVFSLTMAPVSAEDAGNAVTLNTLTTLYEESVSDTYSISSFGDTVVPLEVTAQGNVTITIDYPDLATDYICKVYTDDSYISMIHSCLLSSSSHSFQLSITAGGSEMLYLYFTPSRPVTTPESYDFTLSAALTPAKAKSVTSKKTLQNGSWTKKKTASVKTKHYYKLVINKNSYFHINSNNTYINVQLWDATKKKALSKPVALRSSNNFQSSFALGKGTYYVLVSANNTTAYQIYYQTSSVKNIAGDKLSSASRITLGKQYINIIKATSRQTDGQFYKVKLPRSQKLQIAFYVENSSGQFELQLFDGNKQPLPTNYYRISNASLLYINSRSMMPKDTYYFRVSKVSAASSGCYSLTVRTLAQ